MATDTGQGHLAALLRELCPAPDAAAQDDQAASADSQDAFSGEYAEAAASINCKFDERLQQAVSLKQRLLDAFREARQQEEQQQDAADAAYTAGWRATGLPSKAAQVASPPQKQQPGGLRKLLDAGSILAAHQRQYTAEVLQPPVVFTYNDSSRDPHYLNMTASHQVRNTMVATARANSTSPTRTRTNLLNSSNTLGSSGTAGRLEATDRSSTSPGFSSTQLGGSDLDVGGNTAAADALGGSIRKLHSKQQQQQQQQQHSSSSSMHAEQLEAEHKIIRNMHHRLTFKRNPRYPLPANMALLDSMAVAADRPLWLGTTGRPRPSPAELAAQRAAARTRQVQVFRVDPNPLVFTSYEAGYAYQQVMRFVNTTATMASLRVLPPSTQHFQVSEHSVPGNGNDVAPGMAAELTVTFTPHTRGAYSDVFTLVTPMGSQDVHLSAQRTAPQLDLPSSIDVGHVVVGGRVTREILVTNTGGPGCFMLLPAAQQHLAAEAAAALVADTSCGPFGAQQGCPAAEPFLDQLERDSELSLGAFKVIPGRFDLQPGQQVRLSVSFSPQAAQQAAEELVLVADNCTQRQLQLVGCGSHVDVQVVQLDGQPVAEDILASPVWFGEVVPGSQTSRVVTLCNNTALPFAFNWQQQQQQQQQQAADSTSGKCSQVGGSPFSISPAAGVIHPGELLQVTVTFAPRGTAHSAAAAALVVDPYAAAGAIPVENSIITAEEAAAADVEESKEQHHQSERSRREAAGVAALESTAVQVLQLFLEGAGRNCQLQAQPPAVQCCEALDPQQAVTLPVVLRNSTAAAVSFKFEGLELLQAQEQVAEVVVEPAAGSVPPEGELTLQVTVTGVRSGSFHRQLLCRVDHGGPLLLPVMATVVAAVVVPAKPVLDFGLLQLGVPGEQQLVLDNTSSWSEATWSLELTEASQSAARPTFSLGSSSGSIPASISWGVPISCAADVPGTHEVLLRCSSGGSCSLVQLRVTVAVPDIQLSSSRIQLGTLYTGVPNSRVVRLRNTCRIPVQYKWAWQQVPTAAPTTAAAAAAAADKAGGEAAAAAAATVEPEDVAATSAAAADQPSLLAEADSCQKAADTSSGPPAAEDAPGPLEEAQDGAASEPLGAEDEAATATAEATDFTAETGDSSAAAAVRDEGGAANNSTSSPDTSNEAAAEAEAASSSTAVEVPKPDGLLQLGIYPAQGSLAPGEEIEVVLKLDPIAVGGVRILAGCCVLGMPSRKGLLLEADIQGLQLDWQVVRWQPEQPAPTVASELQALCKGSSSGKGQSGAADATAVGDGPSSCSSGMGSAKVVAADFGFVQMREDAACLLLISNLTSVPAPVNCWIEDEDSSPGAGGIASGSSSGNVPDGRIRHNISSGASAGRVCVSASGDQTQQPGPGTTRSRSALEQTATTSAAANHTSQPQSLSASHKRLTGSSRASQQRPSSHTLQLSDPGQVKGPFQSVNGNFMMSERTRQHTAAQRLAAAGSKGWVVVMEPAQALLPAWSNLGIKLLSHNDVPGDYMQDLCVQVGDLPVKRIPMRLRVAGSPLQLHKQRVLLPASNCLAPSSSNGITLSSPLVAAAATAGGSGAKSSNQHSNSGCKLLVDLGQVLPQQKLTETFYITNTGGMAVSITWDITSNAVRNSSSSGSASGTAQPSPLTSSSSSDQTSSDTSAGSSDASTERTTASDVTSTGYTAAAVQQQYSSMSSGAPGEGGNGQTANASAAEAAAEGQQEQATPKPVVLSGPSSLLKLLGSTKKQQQQQQQPESPSVGPGPATNGDPATADTASHSGFVVSPLSAVIPPGQKAAFQVQFCSSQVGYHQQLLVGKQALAPRPGQTSSNSSSSSAAGNGGVEGDAGAQSQPDQVQQQDGGQLKLKLWPTGDAEQPFQTVLKGGFHPTAAPPPQPLPPLCVTLRAHLPQLSLHLEPDSCCWNTQSIHNSDTHPSYCRTLVLTNCQRCPVSFGVLAAGPFELLGVRPYVEQDPDRFRGTKAFPELISQGSGVTYLPPGQATEVTVRCRPPANLLQQLDASGQVDSAEVPGQLLVEFTCGTQQVIPLTVTQFFPRVTLSSTSCNFGKVHPSNPKSVQLTLTNPTTVDATWSAEVVQVLDTTTNSSSSSQPATGEKQNNSSMLPSLRGANSSPRPSSSSHTAASGTQASKAGRPGSAATTNNSTAAAGALFSVSQIQGCLPGRGLGMPHKQTITVTFSPSSGVQSWEGVLRVVVAGGPVAEVVLSGQGDLKEPLPGLPNIRGF